MDSQKVVDKLSRTSSVLGDTTRTKIVSALSKTELCVAEISMLPSMSYSAISHQPRVLKDIDLINCREEERGTFYMLNDSHTENLFEEGLKHVLVKL